MDEIKKARLFAKLLDAQFKIGDIRFGLDPIINLIPVVGDFIGVALSLHILNIGRRIGVSRIDLARMALNIVIDFIVGFIPFVGVLFDVGLKANLRNLRIIEKYEDKLNIKGPVVEGKIVD